MTPGRASARTVARVDLRGIVTLDEAGALDWVPVRKRLMDPGARLGNAIVVGDEVTVEGGAVTALLPRRNRFERRAAGAKARARVQVLAANLDLVLGVVSLRDPPPSAGLVDRFAVTCEWLALPFALAFTKADLARAEEAEDQRALYARAGYPVHLVAALEGRGLADLRQALRGRRTLFLGHSGVGKSTLLSALVPGLELAIGAVNAKTGKGRHTTTAATLVRTEEAPRTEVIDTPGVRTFGLPGVTPRGLARAFPELRGLPECRFRDCLHRREPGCAVREAARAGDFRAPRYQAYLRLLEELEREALAPGGPPGGR